MSKSRENRNHISAQQVRAIRRALKEYDAASGDHPEDDHSNLVEFAQMVRAALKSRSPR